MPPRPRVIILGGGMAGLATAWELSHGDWRSRLGGITVYQRGWRLGGKGASSRGRNGRIEEHGLHLLLGYYDETFRILRGCYAELDRERTDPDCPIRTWDQSVRPSGDIGLAETADGRWSHFVTRFSTNGALPGEPGIADPELSPIAVARRSIGLLLDFHRSSGPPPSDGGVFLSADPDPHRGRRGADLATAARTAGLTVLAVTLETADLGMEAARLLGSPALMETVDASVGAVRDALRRVVMADPGARRTWYLVDLVATNLRGMITDRLLLDEVGFGAIDHLDYRQWLGKHGAAAETVDSPIVQGMYDLVFGYEAGDRDRPRFSAGVGLQLAGRMLFDFKGGIFWRMQAGMGEVVFAPLYQALRSRGVEFRFFHRLDDVRLSPDGRSVGQIMLSRQVETGAGVDDDYQPLIRVGGLPSWPDAPDPAQLATHVPAGELETHGAAGSDAGHVLLRAGDDFDTVVLAVPVGMIPYVCAEVVAADDRWSAMVANIGTVATQTFQVWLDADERALGWHGPQGTTLSGFAQPFDTWASMTHLLDREQWGENPPRSIAYFCGSLPDEAAAGDAAGEGVRRSAIDFLDRRVGALWPGAVDANGGFRWDLLHTGTAGPAGSERFDSQYWRANTDPSERYVQSLPGTDRFRLRPDDSGYDNLMLAGDWTDCGLNAGCVEAAARSGVIAARAILDRRNRTGAQQ